MHFTKVLSLAAVALCASASPVTNPTEEDAFNKTEIIDFHIKRALAGWGYATFYDDNACTSNPGTAVSISNPGCLAEYGRNSIYVQPGTDMTVSTAALVWSPADTCDCQNDCATVDYNGGSDYCWNLNGHQGASSFRFVTNQDCDSNNC